MTTTSGVTNNKPTVSIDIDLINIFSNKDKYNKYIKYIKEYSLISNTKTILDDIPIYFSFYPEKTDIDWDSFSNWFGLVQHPSWKKEKLEMFQAIFHAIKVSGGTPNENIVQHFIKMDYAARINGVLNAIANGKSNTDLNLIGPILDEYNVTCGSINNTGDGFASVDIKEILDNYVRAHGLEWRLEDLNVCVGPLHQSDFVIVGARPEVGKTSFLCSEFTNMVAQLTPDKEAIIFNNEERGKLFLRLVEAGTGMGLVDIAKDENAALRAYTAVIGGKETRIRVCEPEGGLSTYDIEAVLKKGNYGLIGINVLDKVRGFNTKDGGGEVARMRALAQWTRGLANKYAPVIAVQQADASADGVRYPGMAQLYGSKTGIQGEGDAILMIGFDDTTPDTRYFHVAKNKLPGGPRTLPGMRHGRFESDFDPETGRYTSKLYRGKP